MSIRVFSSIQLVLYVNYVFIIMKSLCHILIIDNNTSTSMIWVPLNMGSSSTNRQGISQYLASILYVVSSSSSIPTAVASGRRHPCSLLSDVHGCLLSAIVRFRWLEAVFGTVCHLTSPQLLLWLFFRTASKLISFTIISYITVNIFLFFVLTLCIAVV